MRLVRRFAFSLITALCGTLAPATWAAAQSQPSTAPTSQPAFTIQTQGPLAGPIVNVPAKLAADKVTYWHEGRNEQWLLMRGNVTFSIGVYGFTANNAVVRIETQHQPGATIRLMWLYLDQARPLKGRTTVAASAPRLLVAVSTAGGVSLATNLLQHAKTPVDNPLVRAARQRMAHRRAALSRLSLPAPSRPLFGPAAEARRAAGHKAIAEEQATRSNVTRGEAERIVHQAQHKQAQPVQTPATTQPANGAAGGAILPVKGVVHFGFDRIVVQKGPRETAVMLIGDVRVIYQDYQSGQTMALKADRAVVFVKNGAAQTSGPAGETAVSGVFGKSLAADQVTGVYLEDDAVATNGQYTVRAPRIFYDIARNKAVLLDAVLYAYDVRHQVPLYLRARVMRQESATDFSAKDATLTNSAFAEPFIALHAGRIQVSQTRDDQGTTQHFSAHDVSATMNQIPVFYWPWAAGDSAQPPLRSATAAYSQHDGMQIETRWDLFSLAGSQAPQGVDVTGNIDYRGTHGPAVGADLKYRRPTMTGRFHGYALSSDSGEDHIGGRNDVPHDDETRGYFHFQHRQDLAQGWELSLEAADVSDPTFLEEFFPSQAYDVKPYENSFYLEKQQDDSQLSLLGSGQLTDFLPQTTLLQSRGFSVEKFPELAYTRTGTTLWAGRLVWFSENSVSRMKAVFGTDTPTDRGFTQSQSQQLFGIDANTSFADAAKARNFPTDWRNRLDTRQEIDAPMKAGFLDITPYMVGRFTAYDDGFGAYNGGDDQNTRLWGQIGTRVHAAFHRTYDVNSDLLNLHQIRHIIEPSVNVFVSGSTLSPEKLPPYDPDVESISQGAGVEFGLVNTLQTQRGGPGRWRDVNWLTLTTNLVLYDHTSDPDNPYPRFFNYRPEYSTGGNHFYTQLLWMVSDTLGVTGELTDSLVTHKIVQWRVGATMQHTPRLSSFLSYEELDPLSSRLLSYGFTYQLTTKYRMGLAQTINFATGASQSVGFWLQRALPQWQLRVMGSFDALNDDTTLAVVLLPNALASSGYVPPFLTQSFER